MGKVKAIFLNKKGGVSTLIAELLGLVALVIGLCIILNIFFDVHISVPELCHKLGEQLKSVF